MPSNWKAKRARERIESRFKQVESVTILDYTKEMSLENIPVNRAYRVQAAHLYLDILNVDELLGTTDSEGTTCHKRALRFLNLHYRAVHRILGATDVRRVDFHNQRLHAVVTKPYGADSERERVVSAVAVADLIDHVLQETGDADESIPNAKVRVGIDTGLSLVVNNGRHGGREPLFLGRPANHAAKCAGAAEAKGIYLTNSARVAIGLAALDHGKDRTTALTAEQIAACVEEADLDITKDQIVREWQDEQRETPIGTIEFSRPTPPLKDLDINALTLANAKRFEGVSVYADIDGFTAYVDEQLEDAPEDVVRTLHVLRSELDAVVSADFQGRRVRFIGDCLHGCLMDGTAYATDAEETVSNATLCAGALRSSFTEALDYLEEKGVAAGNLGLAIGFDFGPIAIARLGMSGSRVRCAIGRSVLSAEAEQRRCNAAQTALGAAAYAKGSEAVRDLFKTARRVSNLDYDSAVTSLAATGDRTAAFVQKLAAQESRPAIVPALTVPLRGHSA